MNKKVAKRARPAKASDMREEYDFTGGVRGKHAKCDSEYRLDCTKAKPNRFAARAKKGSIAVLLDEDVARVFKTSEAVNSILKAIIEVMPVRKKKSASKKAGTR